MNLPAMSIEFVNAFRNLYNKNETELIKAEFSEETRKSVHLNVFCYHFSKNTEDELKVLQKRISDEILGNEFLKINSKFVRKVAPNKDMFCSMFSLTLDMLLTNDNETKKNKLDSQDESNDNENMPPLKIAKTD
jgi:hypothetical protein